MQILKNISFTLGVLVMSLVVGYLAFAWTDAPPGTPPSCPGDYYPGCDTSPLNESNTPQAKEGALVVAVNPAVEGTGVGLIVKHGNVGIGTITAQTKLVVNGGMKIGTQETCNSEAAGAIRYNSSKKALEACNGEEWIII